MYISIVDRYVSGRLISRYNDRRYCRRTRKCDLYTRHAIKHGYGVRSREPERRNRGKSPAAPRATRSGRDFTTTLYANMRIYRRGHYTVKADFRTLERPVLAVRSVRTSHEVHITSLPWPPATEGCSSRAVLRNLSGFDPKITTRLHTGPF